MDPVANDAARILIVESAGQFRANAIARLVRDLDDDAKRLVTDRQPPALRNAKVLAASRAIQR